MALLAALAKATSTENALSKVVASTEWSDQGFASLAAMKNIKINLVKGKMLYSQIKTQMQENKFLVTDSNAL